MNYALRCQVLPSADIFPIAGFEGMVRGFEAERISDCGLVWLTKDECYANCGRRFDARVVRDSEGVSGNIGW